MFRNAPVVCIGVFILDKSDNHIMTQALSLAEKGVGWTSPNPMVGAIITLNGEIVGKGYHQKHGEEHAEINAIRDAGEKSQGAHLYVTLEPCSIHGKTPPCTDAIIQAGIATVSAAMKDPNPEVNGNGLKILKDAGINIQTGMLESSAKKLNEKYVKYMSSGMPWVSLKAAQTLDGRIADVNGESKWITSEASRKEVHKLRSTHDAVLVGAGTVIKDNPGLDVRHVDGKQPCRVVIDEKLESPSDANLFNIGEGDKTLLFTSAETSEKLKSIEAKGVRVIKYKSVDGIDIKWMLGELVTHGISSVLVEGGSKIFSSFLDSGLVDRYIIFVNPSIMGSGLDTFDTDGFSVSNRLELKDVSVELIGEDIMVQGLPDKRDS